MLQRPTESTATAESLAVPRAPWAARAHDLVRAIMARCGAPILLDQAVVSGTNFMSSVIIGRLCGKTELGRYSLAFSLLVVTLSSLQGLVTVPYTVFGNRVDGAERAKYAGGSLIQVGFLALIAMFGLLVGSGLDKVGIGPSHMAPVLAVLAAVIPLLMLREFARSFSIAHFRPRQALLVDSIVSAIQLGGLVALATLGWLSAGTAFALIGIGCGVTASVWLIWQRGKFRFVREAIAAAVRRNLAFGRWIFAGQLVGQIKSEILLVWLVALVLGKEATGAFSACMTIVMFSNPLMIGVNQVMTPRVSKAFAEGGVQELRRVVWSATIVLVIVMGLFCIAVAVFGNLAIQKIFGPAYAGQGLTMTVLAFSLVLSAAALAPGNGLWALEKPQVNFHANIAGLMANATVSFALVWPLGLLGVACGMLAGHTVELLIRNAVFWRLTKD